ncbi:MAG: hypothetical protein F6K26_39875 [Moorea sp. SIO2I5]|nr:hypothetical protein [Moorena sp. SIO2I5]
MEASTIFQSQQMPEVQQIKKGLNRLGLNASDPEIYELNLGNAISLESRELSEIGSVFIMASAVCPLNGRKPKKQITFGDLPKAVQESACCSGIPIYCWQSDEAGKRCLYLTVVNGHPAIRTCCQA